MLELCAQVRKIVIFVKTQSFRMTSKNNRAFRFCDRVFLLKLLQPFRQIILRHLSFCWISNSLVDAQYLKMSDVCAIFTQRKESFDIESPVYLSDVKKKFY